MSSVLNYRPALMKFLFGLSSVLKNEQFLFGMSLYPLRALHGIFQFPTSVSMSPIKSHRRCMQAYLTSKLKQNLQRLHNFTFIMND